MNIIVCLKQVPDTTNVEIDEKTGSLKREGVESKINVCDLYALEAAFRIREKTGGTVTVLSMGPPQAKQAVREALMLGADDGYLVSDRHFAASDVLATSYALSQAVRIIGGFDLIVCGKQTTDGDTAQVGPALAEQLHLPHAAWITKVIDVESRGLILEQDLTDSILRIRLDCPCLITVEKDPATPRLPSYLRKLKFSEHPVKVLSLLDFQDKDPGRYGSDGSPTRVEKVFPPEENAEKLMLEGSPEDLADQVAAVLISRKFI